MIVEISIKKIFFNAFLIFSILCIQGISQQKSVGGIGYFSTGYQTIDIKDLNSKLKSLGYPEFDKSYTSIGGGGFGVINDFVIGGEGYGLISSDLSNQFYQNNLTAGYGLFDVGYLVYSSDNLIAFPLIGFGAGGIDLRINEKSLVDFDSVLINPKRGSVLSIAGLMFNFGFNVLYRINLSEDVNKPGGLSIGLNFGYTHFLQMGNWTLFDTEIANGPRAGLSGFYIRFSIGGGGFNNQ